MTMTTALANRKYIEETKKLKDSLEEGFLKMGERLNHIRENRLWEVDYDSYALFLMDIKVSEATASKLVAIYKRFVVEYGFSYERLAPCSWSSLYQLLPLAKTKEEAEDLIDDASKLKRGDVEEKVRDVKHPNCKHADCYTVKICRQCGARFAEHDHE